MSTSFSIVGYEYAFTSSVGSFAGNGSGNTGGTGYSNMTVRGPGSSVDAVVGTFSHHGGKITTLDRGANCTNQKYLVTSTLKAVSTPKTSNGTGKFEVTLTHYRHRLLGRCVADKATDASSKTLRSSDGSESSRAATIARMLVGRLPVPSPPCSERPQRRAPR